MNPDHGKYLWLSLPRRWMCDFLHASRGMPLVPLERRMDLGRLAEARDQFEKDYILRALAAAHGNMSKTAELLGVERSNLYKKMKAFGIAPRRDE